MVRFALMTDALASLQTIPRLGEILSINAAFLWGLAIVMFRVAGRDVGPLALNLFKCTVAVALLAATIPILGQQLLPPLRWQDYVLFLSSGILGIALADTLLLKALNKLGAELIAIIDCAYSPFVIGLSFLYLGERMNAVQWAGVGLILLAVLLISGGRGDAQIPRRELLAGIVLGVLSVFFMAVGIVMVKPRLGATPLLWGTMVRMAGGMLVLAGIIGFHPRRRTLLRPLRSGRTLRVLIPASVMANYLSNVSWLAGMRLIQASVASALNQLSTIFIFVLGAFFLKERTTSLKLAAVALAFAGALLISVPL